MRIERANWSSSVERDAMIAIRHEVFVVEQEVPIALELDGADSECLHLLALDSEGRAIGTARMQPDGHIGRIAVVEPWRRRGVGSRLVEVLVESAREAGLTSVDLDAQVHALGFYQKLGFEPRGDVFMEAGISHQTMLLPLA